MPGPRPRGGEGEAASERGRSLQDSAVRRPRGHRETLPHWATDTDDQTEQPRWGKIGKQRIVDEGPLAPFPNMAGRQNWQEGRKAKYDMETFDEVLVQHTNGFMDKAKKDGKPFFIWHNTTRMHVFTYIPPKYQAEMTPESNYGLEEARMAQMDDSIGGLCSSTCRISAKRTIPSSFSPPIMGRKSLPGRMAA